MLPPACEGKDIKHTSSITRTTMVGSVVVPFSGPKTPTKIDGQKMGYRLFGSDECCTAAEHACATGCKVLLLTLHCSTLRPPSKVSNCTTIGEACTASLMSIYISTISNACCTAAKQACATGCKVLTLLLLCSNLRPPSHSCTAAYIGLCYKPEKKRDYTFQLHCN